MRYEHIAGVRVRATFADEFGVRYRYRLEVTREGVLRPRRTVCAIMQNPSCADRVIADKSAQFLEKIVFERNLPEFRRVDRLLIVNQFARIQTTGFVEIETDIGLRNDRVIKQALRTSQIALIAWGASNRFRHRQQTILGFLADSPCRMR
ncbi:MAG: DUF1643 domain-containing protein [Pirellulales bacterium]|nr:DUF1643 domain-containing protein [Pirellulales bacterium]